MGSQDREKISVKLLRRGLAAEQPELRDSGEACPEPEILAAYFENALDAQETARWETHFSHCSRCRAQLAAILGATEPAVAIGAKPQESSRWAWLFDWRWLAPVAAALIIAAIWIARRPTTKPIGEQHPLVAMSAQSPSPNTPQVREFARNETASAPTAVAPLKTLPNLTRGLTAQGKQSREREPSRVQTDDKELASNARNELQTDSLAKKSEQAPTDSGVVGGALSDSAKTAAAAPSPASSANGADVSVPTPRQASQSVTVESETATLEPQSPPAETKVSGAANGGVYSTQAQISTNARSSALALDAVNRMPVRNIVTTPDPKIVWHIMGNGGVELSTDRGTTWQRQQLRSFEPNPQITAGYAPSAKTCWLVGRGGVILVTRDAEHWVPIPPPVDADFSAVTARDNFSATVTTTDGRKFSTDDAGDHWTPAR